ncbi:MAG: hypothetical protein JNK63_07575 [Chthonomonas sp.]|nr:hypothetical protein [Chthonomonas sp.]
MERQFPGEKVWRFEYGPDEFMNDVPGLAAEVIGFGLFKVHEFAGELRIDGEVSDLKEGVFHHSLQAVEKKGESRIETHVGRTTTLNPVFWPIPEHVHEFSGWTLAPKGWSFFEPIYTYEALDPDRPVGAPGLYACYTVNSFFLRNEGSLEEAQWKSEALEFYELDGFPAPFANHARCQFVVDIPEENRGIQIARFLDASSGGGTVHVRVDGQSAGDWRYPFVNRIEPVQADVFGLPVHLTEGKASLQIELIATEGWNAAWYGIDALLPRLQ